MKAIFDACATGIQDFPAEERTAQSVLVRTYQPAGTVPPWPVRLWSLGQGSKINRTYVFDLDILAHRREITLQIQRTFTGRMKLNLDLGPGLSTT